MTIISISIHSINISKRIYQYDSMKYFCFLRSHARHLPVIFVSLPENNNNRA